MKRLGLYLAAVVSAALAAPEAHAAADPSATWMGLPAWIWMLANLVLYFGLLAYFLGPPITRFLEARARRIEEDLAEAKERRAETSELQAGLGSKVAALEAQIEELRARAETEGQKEHEAIREQAVREKERMLAQAQTEIDHRMAQARQELKDYTAALASRLAREQLERELGPTARQEILMRNVGRLKDRAEGLPSPPPPKESTRTIGTGSGFRKASER